MIYPNGHIDISQLLMMIESPEYAVYFESKDEPITATWKKNDNIYHSPNKKLLADPMQLPQALADELSGKGCICYTVTDIYNARHPFAGEEIYNSDKDFLWEYHSLNGRHYKIRNCSYIGEKPKNVPLEIVLFDGDFNSTCFQLGSWSRNDECYEFHSCGSRIFYYVDDVDLPVIWNAIHKADIYLNERFKNEQLKVDFSDIANSLENKHI